MITVWMIYVFLSILVILVLSFVSGLFSTNDKTKSNLEIYECGIESMLEEKTPFYLHFFLIGILFLLFDVELIVCIPLVSMNIFEKVWSVVWFVFFFVLFVGLVLEVVIGTFGWKE